MGGDTVSVPSSTTDDDDVDVDDLSAFKQEFPERFTEIPNLWTGGLSSGEMAGEKETLIGANNKRINSVYAQVIKNYDDLNDRVMNMEVAKTKSKVLSALDNSSLRAGMKCKTRQTYERRVDFVIFVVNGLSVLKCMESNGADTQYMHMVTEVFSSPFLSFKDHKPVIAITHGDLLSVSERVRVRVYVGHLLGVHPSKQTFDIPDNCEPTTELTIVDLVRYALEHADRNLPCKSVPAFSKGSTILLWTHLLLLLAIGIFMFTVHLHGFCSLKLNPESACQPSLEIKKVMEFDQELVPEPDLEIKKVTEIDPGIVTEHILEMKKVIPEIIPKPSKKTKKVDAEKTCGKNQKMKKGRVPESILEIDWKTIRHIW